MNTEIENAMETIKETENDAIHYRVIDEMYNINSDLGLEISAEIFLITCKFVFLFFI